MIGLGIGINHQNAGVLSAPVVTPIATAATGVGQTSFTANWNAFSGAVYYLLDVSTNSSFSTFVYENQIATSTSYVVIGLNPGTTYYYRVRASTEADLDSQAFLTATGITETAQTDAVYNLVASLKNYGIWSKMKAVYPFVTDNRNLLSYTTTFNSSFYRSDGTATITANYTTDPDGTNTAARMLGNSANSYMYYNVNDGLGSGNRTYSIYIKAGTDTNVLLGLFSDGTSVAQNVTLTSSWQRFQLTKNVTNSSSNFYLTIENLGLGLDIFIWGAQVELGSTATTYQPIATTQQSYISSQFKYNLKDPRDLDAAFRLVFNGGWTHSSTGATPNGTNGYADTFLTPSSILAQDSTHLSYYSRTNITNALQFEIGSYNVSASGQGSSSFGISYQSPAGHFRLRISTATPTTSYTPADTLGLFIGNRTSSTQQKIYDNGSLADTSSVTSNGLSTLQIAIAANRITSSSVGDYSAKQTAFASIGDGLSDTEASNFYTAVQAFQTSLSRQV